MIEQFMFNFAASIEQNIIQRQQKLVMNQIESQSPKPVRSSLSPLVNSVTQSQYKKYLKHFESINTPMKIPPAFIRNVQNNKSKYGAAIELYASSVSASIIDQIADSPVKQSQVKVDQSQFEDFVYKPIVGNFNPRIKQRVLQINRFFGNHSKQEQRDLPGPYDDGNLNGYILNIINIDLKNAITRPIDQSPIRNVSRSRSKQSVRPIVNRPFPSIVSPVPKTQQKQKPYQVHEVEVNTDFQPQFVSASPAKLKKIDLLLIEIMKQKKRKGLVPDYFRAIEMKLVQLLEYILQDQPQYFGLSLKDKMKEVLHNLEGFKGKTIDGESKVNMLRIFFEQFRTLKKQKDQQTEGRQQNRSKSNSKKSNSKAQSKNSAIVNQANQSYTLKNKKNFDTQSMGGSHPQQKLPPKKKPSQAKSVKQEDQWIGSLDN